MELYFVEENDDKTREIWANECLTFSRNKLLLRGDGYKNNLEALKVLREFHGKEICSNDESLLEVQDFWNEKTAKWDIFFWRHNKWVSIQDLTIKELRQPHALTKMYRAGAFDE